MFEHLTTKSLAHRLSKLLYYDAHPLEIEQAARELKRRRYKPSVANSRIGHFWRCYMAGG